MAKDSRWHITNLMTYALIAFISMSIVFLFVNDSELLFYNIKLVEIKYFWVQLALVLLVLILFIVLHNKIKHYPIKAFLALIYLLYIFIFVQKAPALSLIFGGFFLTLPPIFYGFQKVKEKEIKLVELIFYIGQLIIFLAILFTLLMALNKSFDSHQGINLSQISNDKIFVESQLNFIIVGLFFTFSILFVSIKKSIKLPKSLIIVFIVLGVGLVLLEVITLSIYMVYKTKTLSSPAFDFGIFTQMFYNMKNFNGMVTTLERGYVLSHNAVHVSPIYYLMLPIFMIFPYPETLQILQAVVVGLGVIPLYLITKHFKLPLMVTLIVLVMYIYHPAIIASSFYDLHENCFLPLFLLFTIYFGLKQKKIAFTISALLTLLIKEDAFIYLVFIGLFLMFSDFKVMNKKELRTKYMMSGSLIIISTIYFFLVTGYINESGDGAMFWRYDNLNGYEDLGLIGIVLSLFQSPSYWLSTMFSPNKILNIIIIFIVLGFIPLRLKKLSYYWLLVPLLLMNFSSTYQYQHQIGFQYYYGSITLLIMMVILWFHEKEEIKDETLNKASQTNIPQLFIVAIILISSISVGFITLDQKSHYQEYYHNNPEKYEDIKETLLSIPSDKKVLATTWLTPYLSDRYHLYHYKYYDIDEGNIIFDYILIDNRYLSDEDRIKHILEFADYGYELSDQTTDYILIFEPIIE